jgi:hypothetical protein
MTMNAPRPRWVVLASPVAVLFGAVTVGVGGMTLFGAPTAGANIVPFVLWFNFVAGFAYMAAGVGLLWWKRWAVWLSLLIAATTILVFAAFGVHVLAGGAFEIRTVGAMALRTAVWTAIAVGACRPFGCRLR